MSIKRTPLRKKSNSESAKLKDEIQRLVREIVMLRDQGCILREVRRCGGELGEAVMQADHLVTRANSATYSDTRLIVCVCKGCHGWKHWNEKAYEALVRKILPKERVALWERAEADRQSHKTRQMDWKKEIVGLKQELKTVQNS